MDGRFRPSKFQKHILEYISRERQRVKCKHGLIVMATGLGVGDGDVEY